MFWRRFNIDQKQLNSMRKTLILLFYSFFLLILGRNLLFIPTINISGENIAKDPQEMRDDILSFLKERKGEYSVYYKDLLNDETFSIDSNSVITAASINKLPIVSYLYHLAAKDEIDLHDTVIIQEGDIQNYGTGSIRYQKPGQQYSLQALAKLALKESDNTAAHVLTIRLGEDNIQAYAYQMGMGSTNMVDNETSARDVGRLLEMLYKNEITSKSLTLELLEYMEDTEFEDRIPLFLPKDLHVYHKTGDGINFIHDAGIISDGKKPYILVVLSSNITNEKEAKETIGKIAQIIYKDRGNK